MELETSGIKKELICIEYPGIVENVDNMFRTLGGLPEVSKGLATKNRRLELRFRPDDPYCKPVCGDKVKTNRLLLRIKVTIVKDKNTGTTSGVGSVKIVGRVVTSVKFKSLCDFQYLPIDTSSYDKAIDLSKSLLPQDISGDNINKWLESPIVSHFPPPAFARVDNLASNSYMYRGASKDEKEECKVIGRTRKRRSGHAVFVSFDVKNVPTKPKEKALKFLEVKLLDKQYEIVKQKFEERPVWSKLALMCVTKLNHDSLKYVLPATAYYFVTGPFRIMWCKFGYDPRINPEAKLYQTLDYRMRSRGGLSQQIKAKRNYTLYVLPNKTSHPTSKSAKVTFSQKEIDEQEPVENRPKLVGDEYLFTPTSIPHTRQMFYQYIDLKLPEIESLFARLPKNPDAVCDSRTGFLPKGFDVHCRDVITSYITANLKKNSDENNQSVEKESVMETEEEEIDDEEDAQDWQVENIEDDDIDCDSDDE